MIYVLSMTEGIGRERIMNYIHEKIYRAICRVSCDISEQVEVMLLELPDDELIDFLSRRGELSIEESICTASCLEFLFNKCKSRKVCDWIINNIRLEDPDILTDHIDVCRHELENSSNPDIEHLQWKIQLAQDWIKIDSNKK